MRFFLFVTVTLLLLSRVPIASAEVQRTIRSSRILFGDLVTEAPPELADLDLGPSPPAGSSRLYSREDLMSAAREAGKKIFVKESVRAVRATKRWTQPELLDLFTRELKANLPSHARLVRIDAPRSLVTAPDVTLRRVELGQLPNRRGVANTSALFELVVDDRLEQRLTVPVVLDLDDRPKPPQIERGASVSLQIVLGSTKVSAAAVALQSTAVGSVGLFRVTKTRKTLRAKLLSLSTAEVVTE